MPPECQFKSEEVLRRFSHAGQELPEKLVHHSSLARAGGLHSTLLDVDPISKRTVEFPDTFPIPIGS